MSTMVLPFSWWVMLFGKPDIPKAPPPQPPPDNAAADAAAAEEGKQSRRRHGRNQNILTSPTGADLGSTDSSTGKKTLGA